MLRYRLSPGYRREQPIRRPKLDAFTGIIDQILSDDREQHRKQRHTAQRIFDRLRDEHAFTGGYSSVKDYVREKRLLRLQKQLAKQDLLIVDEWATCRCRRPARSCCSRSFPSATSKPRRW